MFCLFCADREMCHALVRVYKTHISFPPRPAKLIFSSSFLPSVCANGRTAAIICIYVTLCVEIASWMLFIPLFAFVVLVVIVESEVQLQIASLRQSVAVGDGGHRRLRSVELSERILHWTSVTILLTFCVEILLSIVAFGSSFFTHYG